MKIFKKATASIALVTLLSGIFSTWVSAANSTAQIEAANKLAELGIINNHSGDATGYNLDQGVLRQEIAAVALGIAGLSKKTTCDGYYSDVTATKPNNWACYSIEALADAGIVSKSNKNFRPEDKISKAEALGIMVKASWLEYTYDSSSTKDWKDQVIGFGVESGIISATDFTDPDTASTRGLAFVSAKDSIAKVESVKAAEVVVEEIIEEEEEDEDDILGDLLGWLDDDEDEEEVVVEDVTEDEVVEDTTEDEVVEDTAEDTNTDDTTDDVVSNSGNKLVVSLSPNTAETATIPGAINGLPVAKFDFTAGSEDVTVTSLIVKRKGLSASTTLTSLAVFTDEGRVSKGKNDSEENNTQATLNLNTWGITIMAGETETISVVVDVAATAITNGAEFAIELLDVTASSDVEGIDNLVANTMTIGWVDASNLTVDTNGTVSNPTLGEDDSEIFKFKLENWTDFDIIAKSITFKWDGTIDEEDELANFKLVDNSWNTVSEVASTNGKYLTFDLGDGFTVSENKTEKFKVTADIIWGAGKTVSFYVDKNLDITANDTQYGFWASVVITNVDATGNLWTLTVQAGQLTLVDIDPTVTTIKEDKKDIILGKLKVVNNAWNNLEIQKFGVKLVITDSNSNVTTVGGILDNIELYDETNGTTYDLATVFDGTDSSLTEAFQDADLNITVPSGETVFAIRADTVSSITAFDGVTIVASVASGDLTANGWLYIVETEDDTVVTDITPSSLNYKTVSGAESSASVATIVMSDSTAVIGSKWIKIGEFQISADESSSLEFTNATTHLSVATAADSIAAVGTLTIAWALADWDTITIGTRVYEIDTLLANNGVTSGNVEVQILGADTASNAVTAIALAVTNDTSSVATATDWAGDTVVVTSNKKGTTGNSIVSTETGANSSFDAVTLGTTTAWVGSDATSSEVAAIYLMKWTSIIDQVSGSQLSSGVATFDWFNETIPSNGSVNFDILVDLIDDTTQATDRIAASIQSIDVEDEDWDDVAASGLPWMSARDLTISGVGTLTIAVDNTDSETDKTKNILGNTTSPFVASYELTAVNEDVLIKDLSVVASHADFTSAVSEVILYSNDKTTEIWREPVVSTTVTFDNINYVASEGNENLYIKVVTRKIGKDSAGKFSADMTLTLQATDVEGNDSGKAISTGAGVASATSVSLAFKTVPVKISAVAFVDSASGVSRATTLNNGDNNVAIISVTADSNTNTDNDDASSLKSILEQVVLDVSNAYNNTVAATTTTINTLTIEKINGNNQVMNSNWTITDISVDADQEVVAFTPVVMNSTAYTLTLDSIAYTYTSDSSATAAEIIDWLNAFDPWTNFANTANTTLDFTATATTAHTLTYTSNLTPGTPTNWASVIFANEDAVAGDATFLLTGTDFELDNGTTTYYVVKANVTKGTTADNDDYIKVQFDAFNWDQVKYKSDDSWNNDTSITDARLGITSLDGTQINE